MSIQFTEYDRISDKLVWLSDKLSLDFTVSLASKDRQGGRRSFYYETEYKSSYIGTTTGRGIKRNMMNKYFFVFNTSDFNTSMSLGPRDTYFLVQAIANKVLPWYFGKKTIYNIKDNQLVITGKYDEFVFNTNEYNSLVFTPTVLDVGLFKQAICINCNGVECIIDIDKFIEVYYILSKTDMYNAACSLVNFTKMQPLGVNIWKPVGLGGGHSPESEWKLEERKPRKASNDFLDSKGGN